MVAHVVCLPTIHEVEAGGPLKLGVWDKADKHSKIAFRQGGGWWGGEVAFCGMLTWGQGKKSWLFVECWRGGQRKTVQFEIKGQILFLAPALPQKWPWPNDFSCHWTNWTLYEMSYEKQKLTQNTWPWGWGQGWQWSMTQHHFPKSYLHTNPPLSQQLRKAPHPIWPLFSSPVPKNLKNKLFPTGLRISSFSFV